jgi:hypothetical protein
LLVAHGEYLYATGSTSRPSKTRWQRSASLGGSVSQLHKMDAVVQLTGRLAHDLNNSLQNIMAALELVRKLIDAGRGPETGSSSPAQWRRPQGAAD